MFRKSHVPTVVVLAVALLVGGGSDAQTTTGRIIGAVTDESGQPLPGVTISISSPALIGGAQTKVTGSDGGFLFVSLNPGDYTVKAELSSFVSQERQEVKVPLGGAAALNITMPQGTFESEIEVSTAAPVIDPTQVSTGHVYDAVYIQAAAVGSANRRYYRVIGQAPGVTGGDQKNVFGSTLSENAWFIDGIDTTEPVTSTWGTLYNFDAIAEIQLQTSGFEAEYGRATGGLVNLITKSGGNQFSGTFDVRYRDDGFQEDGDHFDSSTQETSYQDIAATLGGPLLRDKLWFFVAYEIFNSELTPSNAPSTRDFEGQNYNAKLTWQVAQSWRFVARASGDPAEIANDNASQFVAPEATSRQEQGADVFAVELNAVLSDRVVWNTVAGLYRSTLDVVPMSGDLETPSHFNSSTFLTTGNFPEQSYSDRDRDDLATDLTVFVGNLGGSHEFKLGLQYSGTELRGTSCLTGSEGGACSPGSVGFAYEDFGAAFALPSQMTETVTAGRQTYTGQIYTAYLQDSWRVLSNLTIKAGVRFDQVSYDNNAGRQIADMSVTQPRIGIAWDVMNDARNVVRADWGRFMDPASLSLPFVLRAANEPSSLWYSCSTWGFLIGVPDPSQCGDFATLFGFQYRPDDPDGMDPFGWYLLPWNVSGVGGSLVQSDLQPTSADTLSLSYEREVGNRASLELTYVNKKTRDIFEDTCAGNYPEPTEGVPCDQYILANLPDLARDYQGYILRFETRSFSWLTLLASYTYSKSEGNLEWSQGASEDFDLYPWHYDNRYGYLRDHRKHQLKLNGYFYLKGDWTIAFDGFWSSAFTWEPQATPLDFLDPSFWYGVYYVEPRGSRDGFDAYDLNLQLSKGFRFGNQVRAVLIGTVYNTLSTEYGTSVCSLISGCGSFVTGEAIAWSLPRSYELGFRIEF